jgi:hypothetical protein
MSLNNGYTAKWMVSLRPVLKFSKGFESFRTGNGVIIPKERLDAPCFVLCIRFRATVEEESGDYYHYSQRK